LGIFGVCGARRSRTYVNMVQVVFPEHFMVPGGRESGIGELEKRVAKIRNIVRKSGVQ
jgi:hypothetical protein